MFFDSRNSKKEKKKKKIKIAIKPTGIKLQANKFYQNLLCGIYLEK